MPEQHAYVRYSDEIETLAADEGDTIAGIIAAMRRESETVAERHGHTLRASHAKSTGLLKGELRVLDGLAEPFRQRLFTTPRTYPALVRLAQGPGELLSDKVSTHRGMAIKVLGVDGPKLPGHEDETTQDFVLATGSAFPQSNASTFLVAMRGLELATPAPEVLKRAVSSVARAGETVVEALGGSSPTLGFFGHPKRNPLADTYYSQAALRYGDHVAKIAAAPASPDLLALVDQTVDTGENPDAFRAAVVAYLRTRPTEFEVRVQLCADLERMPVEDASVAWPESESPYVPVARLVLPAQDAHSPARQAYFDDVLSFRPGHGLAAHRPLGSLMRARLATYPALSAFRHGRNGVAEREPRSLDEVPD